MEKVQRFEIEGAILDIPVYRDQRSQKYLEDYSGLIENPAYTQEGRPILWTIEKAHRVSIAVPASLGVFHNEKLCPARKRHGQKSI